MFIITINSLKDSNATSEISACNHVVVLVITRILEKQKIQFKVSDRNGNMSQADLLTTGYKFWLGKDDVFDQQFSA